MSHSRVFRSVFLAAMFAFAAALSPLALAVGQTLSNAPAVKSSGPEMIVQDVASAGRLRMQSQRLAKLYQQLGMGINVPVVARQIGMASTEVDGEFARLVPLARNPKTQRVYNRCDALWQELREALRSASSPAGSERVNQLADELMIHSGKLVMLIEAEAETPVGRLLDLSSRLNMLAQRLARLYLLAQDSRSQGVLIDIEQARKEFAAGLNELDTARETSSASREAITLAKSQWIFFELAISQLKQAGRADGKAALHVVTSSERIAQVLDVASSQYVKDYVAGLRQSK